MQQRTQEQRHDYQQDDDPEPPQQRQAEAHAHNRARRDESGARHPQVRARWLSGGSSSRSALCSGTEQVNSMRDRHGVIQGRTPSPDRRRATSVTPREPGPGPEARPAARSRLQAWGRGRLTRDRRPGHGRDRARRHHKSARMDPRPLRHGITLFILLLFVEYVLIPSFLHSKARSSLSQLGRFQFLLVPRRLRSGSGRTCRIWATDPGLCCQGRPRTSPKCSVSTFPMLAVSHVNPRLAPPVALGSAIGSSPRTG